MRTFIGVCIRHVHTYAGKTGAKVFLNIQTRKIPAPVDDEEPKDKVKY